MIHATAERRKVDPVPSQDAALDQEPVVLLEAELTRLEAEILAIHSGFQLQIVSAIRQEREVPDQGRLARLHETENLRRNILARAETLRTELESIHTLLTTLERVSNASIAAPVEDFSWMMKKKGEVRVLRAYLDGLQFEFSPL